MLQDWAWDWAPASERARGHGQPVPAAPAPALVVAAQVLQGARGRRPWGRGCWGGGGRPGVQQAAKVLQGGRLHPPLLHRL